MKIYVFIKVVLDNALSFAFNFFMCTRQGRSIANNKLNPRSKLKQGAVLKHVSKWVGQYFTAKSSFLNRLIILIFNLKKKKTR